MEEESKEGSGGGDDCETPFESRCSEFERILFEVPEEFEFPLELNAHMKGKLHSVLEQNWHLKRHLDYLDKEVIELRKYRSEHREKCGRESELDPPNSTAAIMSQRIVDLSKKNREMTSQTEMMKTKITKLCRENESLRNMVECFRDRDSNDDLSSRSYSQLELDQPSTTPGSQHHATMTSKVIEYRRQNQLLKMELKTALRALAQEVGDGATPHNVLSNLNNGISTWRGRQQQIMALQQKLADVQHKLKETIASHNLEEGLSTTQMNGGGDADVCLSGSYPLIPQRSTLIQQDKKKQEQIEKLTSDLDHSTKEWKSCQQELKATKARVQTLEGTAKTYKSHIEILEGKLVECETVALAHDKEMKQVRQELSGQKERERKYRDQAAIEIQEGQRSLQRERGIVSKLQAVIDDKQEVIQRQDGDLIEMKNKLDLCCSGKVGGLGTVEKLKQMEEQLEKSKRLLETDEKERKEMVKMMNNYLNQVEEERKKGVQAEEHTSRITSVLGRACQCINECLDIGQVTNKEVLKEVEHIRTLMRELKMGDLYVYESMKNADGKTKLITQVDMLKREVNSLKARLKEVANARKKDLENFAGVTDLLKKELAEMATPSRRTSAYSYTK